jgi:hypothetical protein
VITEYHHRLLRCAQCGRLTMHDAKAIGPFMASDGLPDIRPTDYHYQECWAMYLHPPV